MTTTTETKQSQPAACRGLEQEVRRETPNHFYAVMLMSSAAKSGHDGTIILAAKLAGAEPCDKCGYVWNHCKCAPNVRVQPTAPTAGLENTNRPCGGVSAGTAS